MTNLAAFIFGLTKSESFEEMNDLCHQKNDDLNHNGEIQEIDDGMQ